MNLGKCFHCCKRPAEVICKGPMIWYPDGKGLYRPEKNLCLVCAKLPTNEIWPITHPNDCRIKKLYA